MSTGEAECPPATYTTSPRALPRLAATDTPAIGELVQGATLLMSKRDHRLQSLVTQTSRAYPSEASLDFPAQAYNWPPQESSVKSRRGGSEELTYP
jgi:hypothetical protein